MIKSMSNNTCFKKGPRNVSISLFLVFFLNGRKQGPGHLMENVFKGQYV